MAYDDEELFAAPWCEEYGIRVFKYDAFLSYRHADVEEIERLTELMRGYGAQVWYDHQDDLEDGRLVEKIGHAIFHSRYMVACLSSRSALSSWNEAELSKALSAHTKGNLTRVVVALLEPEAPIPEFLAGCLVFAAYDTGSRDLAEFITRGNQFDFIPDEIKKALVEELIAGLPEYKSDRNVIQELLESPIWKLDATVITHPSAAL
jgi:hypothetical protein